jgi:hypothetical protein
MGDILDIGKAYQKTIRDKKQSADIGGLFGYPHSDIKKAACKEITYEQAKTVILEYEWLGTMPSQVVCSYGIFYDDILAGAVCFSDVRQQTKMTYLKRPAIILARGACVHWAHKHSASKLISFAVSNLDSNKYHFVLAYSDPEAGEIGTVYQACNWKCVGTSQKMRWISPSGEQRSAYHHRNLACARTPKENGIRRTDKLLAEKIKQDLLKDGWVWVKAPKRYRYSIAIGEKKELKERRMMLDKISIDYPKRKKRVEK